MRRLVGLFLLVAFQANAAWVDRADADGDHATSMNDEGGILMQFCGTDATCYWIISIETRCESGVETPVVISVPKGAVAATTRCLNQTQSGGKTFWRKAVYPFDDVDPLFRGGGIIGMAVPLESGRFRVHRFDTTGNEPVLERMREWAVKRSNKNTKGRTL